MKKHILIMILFTFFMMPFYVSADTYNEALEKASVFLDKNEFKNSYTKYLFTTNTNKYTGMISKEEVDITRYDKNKNYRNIHYSYMWDSRPFWSNVTNVPIREDYSPLSGSESTDNIGTKLTQLIKNDVSVYGSGTYSDPWLFAPQYKVRIKVNDVTKGYITNKDYNTKEDEISFVYTAGSGIQYIYVKSIGANQYLGSTCGYVVNGINANNKYEDSEGLGGYLLVSDIIRDTECIINFGEKPRTVKLDDSYQDYLYHVSPTELYMSPETGWYSDKYGNDQIIGIFSNPERVGYIYEGYRIADSRENACNSSTNIIEPPYKDLASNDYNLVNNSKNRQLITDRNILKNIENNDTLYACYTPIRYTIAYNCNGGGGATSSSNHVYNEAKQLTSNGCSKTGYDFIEWNTSSNGSGASYTNNKEVQGIYSVHKGTLQLYAIWKARDDIAYKVSHYLQNGSDSGYTLKETISYDDGTADSSKVFSPKSYEGFTSPSNQTVTIKADGSTVVKFYYTRNTYTVEYDCNGASGSTASSTHKYDVEKALTLNNCTLIGNKFDGWATTSGGSVVYTDGKVVKNLTVENNKTIKLYAHWSSCGIGTYGSDGKTCNSCPTGYTSAAGSDSIEDCYLVTETGKYVASANANQTTCAANGYCPGGITITYGNTGGRETCPANYGTSDAGSNEAKDCYLTTVAGNYVASANQNQSTCAANGYCIGGEKIFYGDTGGREPCPTNYGTSPAGSNEAEDCYLTTSTGKYVKTKNAAQVSCAANGYCIGGIKVKYGDTGGRETCPTDYATSAAGSDAEADCYLTTSAGSYVAEAYAAQVSCTANGYCPGGETITYGDTGGRETCPTYYTTSAAGSDAATDCYLTTDAGKYVATKKADQTTCLANYYCSGGAKIFYEQTGVIAACSAGQHSDAGASSCDDNTYKVAYKKNSSSATGTMGESSHTYGKSQQLTANAFSRSGYTFNGWNTESDGSGTSYADKASVKNLTTTNKGTVNLYAQWKVAVSCDAAAITYYNQNWNINGGYPYECDVYNGVYKCSANTSTGKCDCDIKAFYRSSKYYCCNFDKKSFSPSYTDDSGYRWCERSYTPVSKSGSCSVPFDSYNWCDKYW